MRQQVCDDYMTGAATDSESDGPDYYPSDSDIERGESYNSSMVDRCRYIANNKEVLEQLYAALLSSGHDILGDSFLQMCTFSSFANFCYMKTTPTSDFFQ